VQGNTGGHNGNLCTATIRYMHSRLSEVSLDFIRNICIVLQLRDLIYDYALHATFTEKENKLHRSSVSLDDPHWIQGVRRR